MAKSRGAVLSLGAGENQIPFILAARELGYEVIGIDRMPSAPGFIHCKTKIIESITEYRKIFSKILSLSLSEPLLGVGCRSFGKAVYTASYLAEKFSLPGAPTSVVRKFYDKGKIKKFLQENGIPVPRQFTKEELLADSKKKEIPYPLIYKPVDGASKKDIKIIYKFEDFKKTKNPPKNFFFEEFIDGPEFTILGFVSRGKLIPISITDKFTTSFSPYLEIAHSIPTIYPQFEGELLLYLQRIVHLVNYTTGPVVAEFKANSRGELYLMEVMPEVGGEFLAEEIVPRQFGYDYFQEYTKLITGEEPSRRLRGKQSKQKKIIHFMVPPPGKFVFKRVDTLDEKRNLPFFFQKELIPEEGVVDTELGNRARVRVFGYTTEKIDKDEFIPTRVGNLEGIFEKYE